MARNPTDNNLLSNIFKIKDFLTYQIFQKRAINIREKLLNSHKRFL